MKTHMGMHCTGRHAWRLTRFYDDDDAEEHGVEEGPGPILHFGGDVHRAIARANQLHAEACPLPLTWTPTPEADDDYVAVTGDCPRGHVACPSWLVELADLERPLPRYGSTAAASAAEANVDSWVEFEDSLREEE